MYTSVAPCSDLSLFQHGLGDYENVGDWTWELYPFAYDFLAPADSTPQPAPVIRRRGFGQVLSNWGPLWVDTEDVCDQASAAFNQSACLSLGGQLYNSKAPITAVPFPNTAAPSAPPNPFAWTTQAFPTYGFSGLGCGCGCGGGCQEGLGQTSTTGGLFGTGLFSSSDPANWGWGEGLALLFGGWIFLSAIGDVKRAGQATGRAYRGARGTYKRGGSK